MVALLMDRWDVLHLHRITNCTNDTNVNLNVSWHASKKSTNLDSFSIRLHRNTRRTMTNHHHDLCHCHCYRNHRTPNNNPRRRRRPRKEVVRRRRRLRRWGWQFPPPSPHRVVFHSLLPGTPPPLGSWLLQLLWMPTRSNQSRPSGGGRLVALVVVWIFPDLGLQSFHRTHPSIGP